MRSLAAPLLALFCCWPVALPSDDKPVVYTLSGPRSKLDDLTEQHYGKLYRLVELNQRVHNYVSPMPVRKHEHPEPVYAESRCVGGKVLLLIIVTSDGAVISPHTVSATDSALAIPAAEYVTTKPYQPATLDGTAVAVVLGLLVDFTCP